MLFRSDGSEDNLITENDKTVIGNASPNFYGGINNTFAYKNFDLSIFLTYSYGGEVLNATKLTNTKTALTNKNVLAIASETNRWVTINNDGNIITDPEELATVNAGKTVACFDDNGSNNTYHKHIVCSKEGHYILSIIVDCFYTVINSYYSHFSFIFCYKIAVHFIIRGWLFG